MAYQYKQFNPSQRLLDSQNSMDSDAERFRRYYQQGYTQGGGGYGSELSTAQQRLDTLYNNNNLSQQFRYSNQGAYDKALSDITNRKAFSYDLSDDKLFQQAKEQYQQMGRTAMADTAGQAASMTGGYGNSYATTAAAQAYNAHIQQLNNSIGDYYAMALNTYNAENDRLQGVFNTLSNDRAAQQNEWSANWNVYNNLYNMYSNDLNNLRSLDLQAWNATGEGLGNIASLSASQYNNEYANESNIWQAGEQLKATQAEQAETERAHRADESYKNKTLEEQIRSNKADESYKNKTLEEQIRSNKANEAIANNSKKNEPTKKQSSATAEKLFKKIIAASNNATNGVMRPSNEYSKTKDQIAEKYILAAQKNGTLSASDAKALYKRLRLL